MNDTNPLHQHSLETLTGVRASKHTYYGQYRANARRLDRAIAAIASIAAALSDTTSGVAPLADAVVQAAAEHFEADWVVLWLCDTGQRWTVQDDGQLLPVQLETVLQQVRDQRRLVAQPSDSGTAVGAPMWLDDRVIGVLAVLPASAALLDERTLLVLQTLASQVAIALRSAMLYEASQRQQRELEYKNQQLEATNRWLAVARHNEIVNHERTRIARDLHDSVAQHLLSIGMNLEWCRAQLPQDDPQMAGVRERISSTKELARSAVERIRTTIFELSSMTTTQEGLVLALQDLVVEVQRATQLDVQLRLDGTPRPLAADAEHALFQIAQEALFNAYKHANAHTLLVGLHFTRHTVRLSVADDGEGIDTRHMRQRTAQLSTTSHYGLANMRARARELGGTCTIGRNRPQGTIVRVRLDTGGAA